MILAKLKFRLTLVLLLLLLLQAAVCRAESATCAMPEDGSPAELVHTSWSELQGAPPDVVDIVQTSDGYLWLASAWGLVKFDGLHFERIPLVEASNPRLRNLSSLRALRDGRLVVTYRDHGVAIYNPENGSVRQYSESDGLPGSRVDWTVEVGDELWVAGYEGAYRLKEGRWQAFTPVQDPSRGAVHPILLLTEPDGAVISQTADLRALRFPPGQSAGIAQPAWAGMAYVLAESSGVRWFYRGDQELVAIGAAGSRTWRTGAHLRLRALRDCRKDFWFVNGPQGLTRISGTSLEGPQRTARIRVYTAEEGLSSSLVHAVFEDRHGQVWIGTAGGLDRFRQQHVHQVSMRGGHGNPAMVDSRKSGVLLAAYSSPWRLVDVGRPDLEMGPPGLASLAAASFAYRDRAGQMWVGGFTTVWRVGRKQSVPLPPVPIPRRKMMQAMAQTLDGAWVVSVPGHGLWRWDSERWTRMEDPRVQGDCMVLLDTAEGVWAGFRDGRVVLLAADSIVELPVDGRRKGRVLSLHKGDKGLWVAGDSGLAFWTGNRWSRMGLREGERIGLVTGMVQTPEGDLWLNEEDGLVRIRHGQILAARGGNGSLSIDRFGPGDGVVNSLNPNRLFPSMLQDHEGRLWFGRGANAFWVDPAMLSQPDRAPSPILQSVKIGNVSQDVRKTVVVDAGDASVQLRFAAPDLVRAEDIRYRVLLEGVDDHWRDIGGSRMFSFGGLQPGQYVVKVQSGFSGAAWSEAGALVMPVTVQPMWYQTTAVRAACGLLIIILVITAYRLRMRWLLSRARARMNAEFKERERIARELHDSLLQSTLGLTLSVHDSVAKLPSDSVDRARLESSLAQAERVVAATRRQLGQLRSHQAQRPLGSWILEDARTLDVQPLPSLTLVEKGKPRMLRAEVQSQFHAIAMEAIRNAARHAGSDRVEIELHFERRAVVLVVRDFGVGMKQDSQPPVAENHFGLVGMRERARLIGAELAFSATPGSGTTVQLSLSGRLAYPA